MNDQRPKDDKFLSAMRGMLALLAIAVLWAISPYVPEPARDLKVALLQMGACLLGLVLVVYSWFTRTPLRRPRIFFWPLTLLVAVMGISALLSANVGNSLESVAELFALYVLYLVASQLYTRLDQVLRFAYCIIGAMTVCTLYGFAQRFGYDPFPWDDSLISRLNHAQMPSTFGNPNLAGHALALAIVLALGTAWIKKAYWLYPVSLLMCAHLLLTHHRAGLLALAAGGVIVILTVLLARRGASARTITIAHASIVLAGIVVLSAFMLRIGPDYAFGGSAALRFNSYYGATEMIRSAPVLGVGPGNYAAQNAPYWTSYEQEHFARDRMLNEHTHSEPLQMAIEGGLVALFAYFAIFVVALVVATRKFRDGVTPEERNFALMALGIFVVFYVDGLLGFNVDAPASAMVFILFAGTLEGVWMPHRIEPVAARWAIQDVVWRATAVLALLGTAIIAATVYISKGDLNEGRAAVALGYIDEGKAILIQGERRRPWNGEYAYELGQIALRQRQPEEALTLLDRSDALRPNYVPTLLSRARAHIAMSAELDQANQKAQALADAQSAVYEAAALCETLPEAQEIYARLLLVYMQEVAPHERRNPTAQMTRQFLQNALEYGSSNQVGIHILAASLNAIEGDIDATEGAYLRAADADASRVDLWSLYHNFAAKHARWPGYLRSIKRATSLLEVSKTPPPTLATIYDWQARGLESSGADSDQIINAYARSFQLDPTKPDRLRRFVTASEDAGTMDRLKEVLLEFHAAHESPPLFVEFLARAWSGDEGSYGSAVEWLATAQTDPTSLGILAIPSQHQPWLLRALAAEVEAYPLDEDCAMLYLNLGAVAHKAEQYEVADNVLNGVGLYLNEANWKAYVRVHSETLLKLDRGDAAVNLLRSAIEREPRDAELRATLARTLATLGRTSLATLEYTMLLATFSFDPETKAQLEAELAALSE